jgi:hypothetical protein
MKGKGEREGDGVGREEIEEERGERGGGMMQP